MEKLNKNSSKNKSFFRKIEIIINSIGFTNYKANKPDSKGVFFIDFLELFLLFFLNLLFWIILGSFYYILIVFYIRGLTIVVVIGAVVNIIVFLGVAYYKLSAFFYCRVFRPIILFTLAGALFYFSSNYLCFPSWE